MSRHQRTRRAALAATGAIVLAALGAGVAQAHVHPTPLEKAAPGVVYIEARANVEVALVEHHAVGDPSGVHIAIIQSAWNPVLASASGFFVDPNGAIVTTGAIRTPDLERAKIYAVNEAFHARYGNAAPLPADPFTRHHIPTAGSHDDERLQACYPPYRTNDAGGCVVSATLDLRVYPYVTSQQRYGNLTAEVLPGTNPDVAVLRVRGANGIPTVPLATSTAKDKALSVLGFLAVPTTFDSLVKVDQHLQVAGGGALRSTGLDAQDVTFARQLRADLPRGLAGGPILAEDGLAMGLLPRPVAAGSAPPPLASLTEIQQALKAAGVTPARGVVDASYETAMHLYKNGSYQASIPFFQQALKVFPGHYWAAVNLANAEKQVASGRTGSPASATARPAVQATSGAAQGGGVRWPLVGVLVAAVLLAALVAVALWRRRGSPGRPSSAAGSPAPARGSQATGKRPNVPPLPGSREGPGPGSGDVPLGSRPTPAGERSRGVAGPQASHTRRPGGSAVATPSRVDRPSTASATRFCTSCGATVEAHHRFCARCGEPLG